jgi:hypothetical protein
MAQCKARSKGSGSQCRRQAVPGATVCRFHGGAAPQVRNAAQARLALEQALDPAIRELFRLLNAKSVPDAVKRQTVDSVLDRNGLSPVHKIADLTPAEQMTPDERKARLRELHAQLFASDTVQ